MNYHQFATLLLAQCLAVGLLWVLAKEALPVAMGQFMKDTILSKRSGRLTRKE